MAFCRRKMRKLIALLLLIDRGRGQEAHEMLQGINLEDRLKIASAITELMQIQSESDLILFGRRVRNISPFPWEDQEDQADA
jgi:hypothetical protein